MESKIVPIVKSSSRKSNYHLRNGKGFSLAEIKKAGKDLKTLKALGVDIDYFRKSSHETNVQQLKALKISEKKAKKREPFVMKEKKRTPYKPKTTTTKKKTTAKKVSKPAAKAKSIPKVTIKEKKPAVKEIVEKTPTIETKTPKITEKVPKDSTTPLTVLTGLGATTANKFESVGVSCVEELCSKDPEELAIKVKGASVTRIETWIKEGKKILEESKK